jgi:hypothetical protein
VLAHSGLSVSTFDAVETVKGMVGVDARQIFTKLPKHVPASGEPLVAAASIPPSPPTSGGRGNPQAASHTRHAITLEPHGNPVTGRLYHRTPAASTSRGDSCNVSSEHVENVTPVTQDRTAMLGSLGGASCDHRSRLISGAIARGSWDVRR